MKVSAAILLALVAVVTSKNIDLQKYIHKKLAFRPLSDIREDEVQLNSNRIVGGSAARLGQFPYQAGLILTLPTHQTVCGGAILNSRRVLTAAHCVVNVLSITVVVGTVTLFSGGQRIDASQIVIHADYDGFVNNDIAMLYLPTDILFLDTVAPIALPSGNELNQDFAGHMATVSGFGIHFTGDSIRPTQFLSFVEVPVISFADCRSYISILQETHICVSGESNTGICSSDSGGPLVVVNNNRRVLVGVTSFGPSPCGRGPSGFVRVTSYINWINNLL